jgi:hypothetical protein
MGDRAAAIEVLQETLRYDPDNQRVKAFLELTEDEEASG